MAISTNRHQRELDKFVERTDGQTAIAVAFGADEEINIDANSIDASGLVGKSSGGDFVTAYASATTIDCTSLPSYHGTLLADDIVSVVQVATGGGVTNTYHRDDVVMSVTTNTITVTGAAFVNTDTFIVYTNVAREEVFVFAEDTAHVTADKGVQILSVRKDSAAALSGTDGDYQPLITDDSGKLWVASGASSIGAEYTATTNGVDGTCVYTSAATVTVSGTPFTINTEDLVYIREVDATGNTAEIWVNGSNGVHMEITSGVITKSGGSDFSSNGVYELGYNGQKKGYNSPTDSQQTTRLNPDSQHFVGETLAAATSQGDGTTYYYVDMAGYTKLGLQIENTDGAAGNNAYTVEATLEDNGTAAVSCDYKDVTQHGFDNLLAADAASYTADAMIVSKIENKAVKYFRVKVVRAADGANTDGAWEILAKRI